jgi:hypothetical protein
MSTFIYSLTLYLRIAAAINHRFGISQVTMSRSPQATKLRIIYTTLESVAVS